MDGRGFTPGDIVLVLDGQGYWFGGYEYVGISEDMPGHLLISEREHGAVFSVRADLVLRPRLTNDAEVSALAGEAGKPTIATPAAPESVPEPADEPLATSRPTDKGSITDAQRRCLFAMARTVGFDIDDLRAATPLGSISALSRLQAADLIDRLSGGQGMRTRPQGTATGKQLGLIAHLRDSLGFSAGEFTAWLSKRFGVDGIEQISDKDHASRVIGGLLRMKEKRAGEGHSHSRRPGRSAAGGGS